MGLFDKFKKTQPAVEPEPVPVKKKRKPAAKKTAKKTVKKPFTVPSPKELATQKGEPWVSVINVELDPNNLGSGSFELDWNEIFLAKLMRAGFTGKTDQQIVDQWFNLICRNVIAENFEQEMADPAKRSTVDRRDIGGGYSEMS